MIVGPTGFGHGSTPTSLAISQEEAITDRGRGRFVILLLYFNKQQQIPCNLNIIYNLHKHVTIIDIALIFLVDGKMVKTEGQETMDTEEITAA